VATTRSPVVSLLIFMGCPPEVLMPGNIKTVISIPVLTGRGEKGGRM